MGSLTNLAGRCGQLRKFCELKLSCSQILYQTFETNSGLRNEEKPARFKRCAKSEPKIIKDFKRRTYATRRRNFALSPCQQIQKQKETPMNHYTINIYVNGKPNESLAKKAIPIDFSVDKLAQNIANGSSVLEGFFDKNEERVDEKLAVFWKNILEDSKIPDTIAEESKIDETPLEQIELKNEINQLRGKITSSEFTTCEKIHIDRDLQIENEKIIQMVANAPIPFYKKGFYDSRTIRPKKIISSTQPQERLKLPQDAEESNKHVENLLRLTTKTKNESALQKFINYFKNFFGNSKKDKLNENELEKEFENEEKDLELKENQMKGFNKNYFEANFFTKDTSKRNYSTYHHNDSHVIREENTTNELNLARNACKLMASFNRPITIKKSIRIPSQKQSKSKLNDAHFSKYWGNLKKAKIEKVISTSNEVKLKSKLNVIKKANFDETSIKPSFVDKFKRDGVILIDRKFRKRPITIFRRGICNSNSHSKENDCKKVRKVSKKKTRVPTHLTLTKRSSGPKEPLKYPKLICREDEPIKKIVKKAVSTDFKNIFDKTREEQFNCYFGEGGYKNKEYYSYTKTSFYDLQKAVSGAHVDQPKSGAKPK